MNKKSFLAGLLSGILITVFLCAMFICARILYLNSQENKQRNTIIDNALMLGEYAENNGVDSVLSDDEMLRKVMAIETIVDAYFIEDIDESVIKEGIYDGIMASLGDKYADYYSADEFTEIAQSNEGIYYGIGAYLQMDDTYGYPKVTGIIKDSPSSETDLRVDDYIYMVDGEDVQGLDLSEVVAKIRGDEGTTVNLTVVRRATGEEIEIPVVRGKVESPTVNYEKIEDGIAYIQITEFDEVTVSQFSEALKEAYADGMEGLILDLRGNPGGSLPAVVDIAGQLLPKGTVVYTMDKYGKKTEYPSAGGNEIQVPMVVLVNGGSASASEILAGAIKDYGKGYLLGTTTYGKGIVQRVIGLNDGSAVKLTVSHYYTPLGNDIHGVGIEPDEVLEFDVDAYLEDIENDNQLDRAIEIIKEDIK
ncbi:MAG: S41 family peptidase [Lachnospiraceae bacterium]|nr:S41 family peptidase [Lachnospiraceae bacterium]